MRQISSKEEKDVHDMAINTDNSIPISAVKPELI